jgi:hypothetical protein
MSRQRPLCQHPLGVGRAPIPGFPFIPPAAARPGRPVRPPRLYWPAVWAASFAAVLLVASFWAVPRPSGRTPARAPARPAVAEQPREAEACAACAPASTGMRVRLVVSPEQAARQARREGKLLFLLHLSGNLEDAQFT